MKCVFTQFLQILSCFLLYGIFKIWNIKSSLWKKMEKSHAIQTKFHTVALYTPLLPLEISILRWKNTKLCYMNINMHNYNKVLAIHFFLPVIFLPIHLERNTYSCIFQARDYLRTPSECFSRVFKRVTCYPLCFCINTGTVICRDLAQRLKKYTMKVQ